jgi:DNA polymerase
MKIVVDFETRSEADLRKVGAYNYSLHPSTEVMCFGAKFGTQGAILLTKEDIQNKEKFHFKPDDKLVAHNAFFEQCIYNNVLVKRYGWPKLSIANWSCTAAKAAVHALPRKLEGACLALGLAVQKDMVGHKVMLKMCKPRKATKKSTAKWHEDPDDFKLLYDYCIKDVEAEYLLDQRLEDLNPNERKIWELDQTINSRGVLVDTKTVDQILSLIDLETGRLKDETEQVAYGYFETTAQTREVLKWLQAEGVDLLNLQKKTVEDVLKENKNLTNDARKILEIRQQYSKTSTKKYIAFKNRASPADSRVRDLLVYHGAATGRWAGSGLQVQNFPKGKIDQTDEAIKTLQLGDLDLVRTLWGEPMDVFSSCLRGMIIPSPDKKLFVADYAAIEARVLFWIANHYRGLKMFTEGKDLYKDQASVIYRKPVSEITKAERNLGKAAVLGCGYQMGAKKFFDTCVSWGIEVTEALAQTSVEAYRANHKPVTQVWYNLETAAIKCILEKKKITVNKTTWYYANGFLWCVLPSGRKLAYYGPKVEVTTTSWGEKKLALHHWRVNSLTKKWEYRPNYGGKLTENVVQAISRDLMADAMLRAENKGYQILMSVHDELIAEKETGSVIEFENLMSELPAWAAGAPITAEGWTGERYRK